MAPPMSSRKWLMEGFFSNEIPPPLHSILALLNGIDSKNARVTCQLGAFDVISVVQVLPASPLEFFPLPQKE